MHTVCLDRVQSTIFTNFKVKIGSGIVQTGSNLHCTVISSCKFSLNTCVNKMRLTTARFCAIPPCSIIHSTTLSAFGTWNMDILDPCSSPNPTHSFLYDGLTVVSVPTILYYVIVQRQIYFFFKIKTDNRFCQSGDECQERLDSG